MCLWDQILKEYGQLLILVGKLVVQQIKLCSSYRYVFVRPSSCLALRSHKVSCSFTFEISNSIVIKS